MDWNAVKNKIQEKIKSFGVWITLGRYNPTSSAPWKNTVYSSVDVPALCVSSGDASFGTNIVHEGEAFIERSFLFCSPQKYPDFNIREYTHADFLLIRYRIVSVEVLNPSGVELLYSMKITR